jgi:hypothetical protein
MAANVRYRSTYYNTTGPSKLNRIDILDTEPVGAIVNFSSTKPTIEFEGITQDLKPGVYTSSFRFGMYIRETPAILTGTSMGVNSDFITDILSAAEGRFLVAHYVDDELDFIGPIIYDQCTYEDFAEPYLLNITAIDGMARWSSEDYVSEVGQIKYRTCKSFSFSYSSTPNDTCLDGDEWVMVENRIDSKLQSNGNILFSKATTYARREVYAKTSPGTGWVDQGQGLWVKEVTYTNETIDTDGVHYYLLTRDIDDDRHRPLSEYFKRAIQVTNMTGEYSGVMYDVAFEWYENDMGDLAADPTTQLRLHEGPLIDKSWMDAMQEFCRTFNMRIYYSNGRYHFEQISIRDGATFTRFIYNADGTSAGAAETASLDLDFSALSIQPVTGGVYHILPPFRSVEAFIQLDKSDLLDGVKWENGSYGMKYLGRIKRTTGTQVLSLAQGYWVTSTFDPSVLTPLNPAIVNSLCSHKFYIYIQIRLTNVELGTQYYLKDDRTWDATPFTFEKVLTFGGTGSTYSVENYGHSKGISLAIYSEDIPDPEGAMYDVHMSVDYLVSFNSAAGVNFWWISNPTSHWHTLETTGYGNVGVHHMKFYSDTTTTPWTESSDTIEQKKTYFIENDVDNSIKVKLESQWGDTNQFEKAVQIYDGTNWVNSSGWSIGGAGDPVELLDLLVTEITSFRTLPRRLYSGGFASSIPNAESRLLRGTTYYLPLSCTKDTDIDTFQGEFLEIARTTPVDSGVISDVTDGEPLPGLIGADNSNEVDDDQPPIEITFETNEVITAGATLTEVDIVNTAGAFVQSGTNVTIINPSTGVQEVVVLSQDVDPDSTVMYFNSKTFTFGYPDASYIIPQVDTGLFPTTLAQVYYYYKAGFTGSSISAPNFNFVDPETVGLHDINKRYKVTRNGIRQFCKFNVTDPLEKIKTYYFDPDAKTWNFYSPGLENEEIEIQAF